MCSLINVTKGEHLGLKKPVFSQSHSQIQKHVVYFSSGQQYTSIKSMTFTASQIRNMKNKHLQASMQHSTFLTLRSITLLSSLVSWFTVALPS